MAYMQFHIRNNLFYAENGKLKDYGVLLKKVNELWDEKGKLFSDRDDYSEFPIDVQKECREIDSKVNKLLKNFYHIPEDIVVELLDQPYDTYHVYAREIVSRQIIIVRNIGLNVSDKEVRQYLEKLDNITKKAMYKLFVHGEILNSENDNELCDKRDYKTVVWYNIFFSIKYLDENSLTEAQKNVLCKGLLLLRKSKITYEEFLSFDKECKDCGFKMSPLLEGSGKKKRG